MKAGVMSRSILLTVAAGLGMLLGGCEPNQPTRSSRRLAVSQPGLPVVSASELETRIELSTRPLLVEFGVDFGCYRCDEMRSPITSLAAEFRGHVDVVRVDFNASRSLAAEYGATICPSYVLFDGGRAVAIRSFPTSADLIAADLASALANGDEEAIK